MGNTISKDYPGAQLQEIKWGHKQTADAIAEGKITNDLVIHIHHHRGTLLHEIDKLNVLLAYRELQKEEREKRRKALDETMAHINDVLTAPWYKRFFK